MRKYLIAVLLAGGIAAPAAAQDAQTPFSGLRVEGLVGYDTTDIEDEGTNGIVYGGAVGYDVQSGGAVFGIEGEVSDSTLDECVSDVTVANDVLCVGAGRDLYVGGRAGAAVSENVLLYAKAGYTNARIGVDYDDGTAGGAGNFTLGENLDGVRIGGGAEFAIGPNSYAKTEYRYSNYEQGFDRHQVVAGFGFRF